MSRRLARSMFGAALCAAGASSCGVSAGPTSWCEDGPSDYVIPAGMGLRGDGSLAVASAWGVTDEGQCEYVREAGAVELILPDGGGDVRDLPGQPGLAFAAGDADGLVSGGRWFAGGIGGSVQHSPTDDLFGVELPGLDASEAARPPVAKRSMVVAGGKLFVLREGSVDRYEGAAFTSVALPDEAMAVTALGGDLVVALQSGDVLAVDPGTLSVSTSWNGCASSSIAPFGAARLALVCSRGVGVLETSAPAAFAVLSTSERFVEVWGGPHVEAALVTTTGGWTRVFTLASGAHAGLAGSVFDAELTPGAAFAVVVDASFTLDTDLWRIPYDGSPSQDVLTTWAPMQVEWSGSGDLILAVGRQLRRLDPATGAETAPRTELTRPPSFDPPHPVPGF